GLASEDTEPDTPVRGDLVPVAGDRPGCDAGLGESGVEDLARARSRLAVDELEPAAAQVLQPAELPGVARPDHEPELPLEEVHERRRTPGQIAAHLGEVVLAG